jgi:hypothetical protein
MSRKEITIGADEPKLVAPAMEWIAPGKPVRFVRTTDNDNSEIEHGLRKQAPGMSAIEFRTPLLNTIFTGKPLVYLRRNAKKSA